MESILAILCIVFFAILTYGLIGAYNLQKNHKYNCHTIYIPEDLDLEKAFKGLDKLTLNGLKRRARRLGATKEFANESTETELKSYVIQMGVSEEHILFTDISEDIKVRDNTKKRDYCRSQYREPTPDPACPTPPVELQKYSSIILPNPTDIFEDPFISSEEILKKMRIDIDDYENKNITFDI
jgi:hypothetical protein